MTSKRKHVICEDVERWSELTLHAHHGDIMDLLYLLIFFVEFRNIFYLRLGRASTVLKWYLRPCSTLFINTSSDNFGSGTFIQHGFATIITAEKIGKNCYINQQVTFGYNGSKKYGYGKPTIEDNVRIACGAKVLGKVNVGEGTIIGANAVVVKDVPSNSVLVPSPMMLIQESGIRVKKVF